MASLVTLTQAKNHLRITDTSNDTDLTLKISQASEVVIAYVKGRYLSVSEALGSGTTITVTTAGLHGLTTGDTVYVFGATEPEYNGLYTVTVTSTTAFTYTVATAPATSPATGSTRLRTTITWTDVTVPPNVQAAVLLVLTDLFEGRPIDRPTIEWLLVGQRDPALA